METSYKVRIWNIEIRKSGGRITSHRVVWFVDGKPFRESFAVKAQAESFRSGLVAATKGGEAFRTVDGRPTSSRRPEEAVSWITFAKDYIDFYWRDASPGHRRNMVDAMATIAVTMTKPQGVHPDAQTWRTALRHLLNPVTRDSAWTGECASIIRVLVRSSRPLAEISDRATLKAVMDAIGTNLDGSPSSTSTKKRKRATLTHALDFAVSNALMPRNPLQEHKDIGKPKRDRGKQVDKRSVVNPIQARTLLNYVGETGNSGEHLVAFFACMYFAALRPEEVANLKTRDLAIPNQGWGELHLHRVIPEISAVWTNSGRRGEEQALKHRTLDESRLVPCNPELTAILQAHLARFGVAPDGRLFRGVRGGARVSSALYGQIWSKARQHAFTEETAASPLAKTPYTLRHACVSTWLAAGIPPTQVAEWAGHSVAVLLHTYAKCIDGGAQAARDRIDAILSPPRGSVLGANSGK